MKTVTETEKLNRDSLPHKSPHLESVRLFSFI
jgi:hypothetical protein